MPAAKGRAALDESPALLAFDLSTVRRLKARPGEPTMPSSLFSTIASGMDVEQFRTLNWEGSFDEYLDIVVKDPRVTRNAYQRLYDMVLSYGQEEVVEHREKITRYKFFSDPISNGRDGVFGLDRPLMRLVSIIKSAAMGYGTERRVLLLHGPVGSAKSTIVRLLKKGL